MNKLSSFPKAVTPQWVEDQPLHVVCQSGKSWFRETFKEHGRTEGIPIEEVIRRLGDGMSLAPFCNKGWIDWRIKAHNKRENKKMGLDWAGYIFQKLDDETSILFSRLFVDHVSRNGYEWGESFLHEIERLRKGYDYEQTNAFHVFLGVKETGWEEATDNLFRFCADFASQMSEGILV